MHRRRENASLLAHPCIARGVDAAGTIGIVVAQANVRRHRYSRMRSHDNGAVSRGSCCALSVTRRDDASLTGRHGGRAGAFREQMPGNASGRNGRPVRPPAVEGAGFPDDGRGVRCCLPDAIDRQRRRCALRRQRRSAVHSMRTAFEDRRGSARGFVSRSGAQTFACAPDAHGRGAL